MATRTPTPKQHCSICNRLLSERNLTPGGAVREPVAKLIRAEHADWNHDGWICRRDLGRFRNEYVHELVESEKGELSPLEEEVLDSLHEQEVLAENVEEALEERATFGERMADGLASFGGSWTFLISFFFFLCVWIAFNTAALLSKHFDPFPYILLNLILSCLAAIQAPIIMMSQNRQEHKDRARSEHDYQINLKAELEIRQLNEKVDHLLANQFERLMRIQHVQTELLEELGRGR